MVSQCDVVVVGAGPAGLITALWLSRLGVKTRILDKRSTKVLNGQADGIQPLSQEMFASFGILSQVARDNQPIYDQASWISDGNGALKRQSKTKIGYLSWGPHSLTTLNQGEIERIILEGISQTSNIAVERGILPTTLSIDESLMDDPAAYPITLEVQHLTDYEAMPFQVKSHAKNGEIPDGLFRSNLAADTTPELLASVRSRHETRETIKTKYLIGTDGAHSWVRNQIGLQMEGESTDYIWGVIDIIPFSNFPDIRSVCMIQSAHGSVLTIPREKKLTRFYVQMAEVDVCGGRAGKAGINPATILTQAKKVLAPYTLDYKYCDWWTAYQVGQRVSNGYQDKTSRIFLGGDAVHTHSPKAGQGMNISMQDGYNLGWKLGGVINGWYSSDILHTYEPERRNIAQDLIALDKRMAATFSGKPTPQELLDVYQANMKFMSGYGVQYKSSSLVASPHDQLQKSMNGDTGRVAKPNTASNVVLGDLFPAGPVVVHATSCPINIKQLMSSDGRWRLLVFAGDISDHVVFDRLNTLGKKLAPLIERYTITRPSKHTSHFAHLNALPEVMEQSLIEVLTIHCEEHEPGSFGVAERDLNTFHPSFIPPDPYTGPDYDRVTIDREMGAFANISGGPGLKYAGKMYEGLGISKTEGALMIVRPDQYISWVGELDDVSGAESLFAGVFRKQMHQSETNGVSK